MNATQRDEFETWLSYFFKSRHNIILQEDLVSDWWDDLKSYSLRDVKDAFVVHRRDEKVGSFPPRVSQILKFIKKPQSNGYKPICDRCQSEAKFCFEQENGSYVKICMEHYEAVREKTEQDLRREKIEKEFIEEAKKLGLTNREMFALKNPKLAEAFCKNENMNKKINEYKKPNVDPPKSVKSVKELLRSG